MTERTLRDLRKMPDAELLDLFVNNARRLSWSKEQADEQAAVRTVVLSRMRRADGVSEDGK